MKSSDVSDVPEQIVKAFPKENYEVVSGFLINQPDDGEISSFAEHSHYFGFNQNAIRGYRLKMMWVLFKYLRQKKFDVIICHRYKTTAMVMRLAKWVGDPKCISVIHSYSDYKPFLRRRFIKKNVSKNCYFIAVSDAVRRHLIELRSGFVAENTIAITNAIDVDNMTKTQIDKVSARAQLCLPQRVRIIGTIGRLVKVKGHIFLIRAFAKIHEEFPDAHLAIIGGGHEEEALKQEVKNLNLTDFVHVLGEKDNAAQYIKAFDIWIMPSLSEGLGLALLEGMSGKIPVIASDVPAMEPLIKGAGGLTCKAGDVNSISMALTEYLRLSDIDLNILGVKAYDYLINNHSITKFRESYLQLVEDIHDL